jgi:hypothetical protein
MICFDVTQHMSEGAVHKKIAAVQAVTQHRQPPPIIYVVGTKYDEKNTINPRDQSQRERPLVVQYIEILGKKALELGCGFVCVSAKTGEGYNDLFNNLGTELGRRRDTGLSLSLQNPIPQSLSVVSATTTSSAATQTTSADQSRGRRVGLWTVLGGLVGAGVGAGLTVQFGIAAGVLFGALALSSPAGIAALAALIVGYFIVSALVTWVVARDKPQPGLQSGVDVRIELKDLYPDEIMARFGSNKDDVNLTPTHHIPAEQTPPRTDTTVTRRPSSAGADEQQPGSGATPTLGGSEDADQ